MTIRIPKALLVVLGLVVAGGIGAAIAVLALDNGDGGSGDGTTTTTTTEGMTEAQAALLRDAKRRFQREFNVLEDTDIRTCSQEARAGLWESYRGAIPGGLPTSKSFLITKSCGP